MWALFQKILTFELNAVGRSRDVKVHFVFSQKGRLAFMGNNLGVMILPTSIIKHINS